MHRRILLATLATAGGATIAGCETTAPAGTTATPTDDPRRTVRVGPSGPGCPGDSWGQMAAITERYDEPVGDVADAKSLLSNDEDRGTDDLSHVQPRPDGIEWKHRRIYVAEAYDADDWYLFLTGGGVDLVGALVVSRAAGGTEVVWFYVGAC